MRIAPQPKIDLRRWQAAPRAAQKADVAGRQLVMIASGKPAAELLRSAPLPPPNKPLHVVAFVMQRRAAAAQTQKPAEAPRPQMLPKPVVPTKITLPPSAAKLAAPAQDQARGQKPVAPEDYNVRQRAAFLKDLIPLDQPKGVQVQMNHLQRQPAQRHAPVQTAQPETRGAKAGQVDMNPMPDFKVRLAMVAEGFKPGKVVAAKPNAVAPQQPVPVVAAHVAQSTVKPVVLPAGGVPLAPPPPPPPLRAGGMPPPPPPPLAAGRKPAAPDARANLLAEIRARTPKVN